MSLSKIWSRIRASFGLKVLVFLLAAALITGLFYWVVADDWSEAPVATDPVSRNMLLGELQPGAVVEQTFTPDMDIISCISLDTAVLSDESNSSVSFLLYDGPRLIYWKVMSVAEMNHDGYTAFRLPNLQGLRGKMLTIRLTSTAGGVTFWYGNTRSAGKFDVEVESDGSLLLEGGLVKGGLVMRVEGINKLNSVRYIVPGALLLTLLFLAVGLRIHQAKKYGRDNIFLKLYDEMFRYRFLLKQLVTRDFKVRYKSSMLGVMWSFLNPLMMTFVYNIVFSTLFRSNIEHFVVYLMSGIILFNYFSEATNLGMNSVVGNATLITKVYIPKYIFPVSKAFSSAINMIISLIPLFIMMIFSGVQIHKSLLLIPFVILFMVGLTTGIGMILASVMVRFRDIQFLWGIATTILSFLTPLFYPESIIPANLIQLYHMNPLYQVIYFMRTITIGGISPSPVTYLYCTLAALVPLAVGIYVFRKTEDSFSLYL